MSESRPGFDVSPEQRDKLFHQRPISRSDRAAGVRGVARGTVPSHLWDASVGAAHARCRQPDPAVDALCGPSCSRAGAGAH